MTPGTLVSDGILKGKVLRLITGGQAEIRTESGGTTILPVHTLRVTGKPEVAPDVWEAPSCVTPGCANPPQPGGFCRSCVRAERKRERAAGIVPSCKCGKTLYSRGLCKSCYERERKGGWTTG